MSWLSKIFGKEKRDSEKRPLVSVDDITFDTTGFEFGKEHPTTRAWRNSDGDVVLVIFHNGSPTYPVVAQTMPAFFEGMRSACIANGNGVVEQYLTDLNEHRAYVHIMRLIKDGSCSRL